MADISIKAKVAQTLQVWTGGVTKVGVGGETAEVTAPGWLLNEEDTDPETYAQQLAMFKEKIISAFAITGMKGPLLHMTLSWISTVADLLSEVCGTLFCMRALASAEVIARCTDANRGGKSRACAENH